MVLGRRRRKANRLGIKLAKANTTPVSLRKPEPRVRQSGRLVSPKRVRASKRRPQKQVLGAAHVVLPLRRLSSEPNAALTTVAPVGTRPTPKQPRHKPNGAAVALRPLLRVLILTASILGTAASP